MRQRVLSRTLAAGGITLPTAGCSGIQSAFVPRGEEAVSIDLLFWTVTVVGVVVTVLVVGLTIVAIAGPPRWREELARERSILGGGIVLPVVVLSLLLVYGLLVLEAGQARTKGADGPGVSVIGKQWWWRVVYTGEDGEQVVSANELRLPVGAPTTIRLTTEDVIHSFWAPQLAGKLDMIPGRTNVLTLEPSEPSISRGQCAEYCGGAHALMAFYVIAMPAAEYVVWLRKEASPARSPGTDEQRIGQDLFLATGCGGCHTIRGTPAQGTIGPDLTHVGSRMSLAAATLPNDEQAFARWISGNQHIKPDNLMPPFAQFTDGELAAIASYLDHLE